MSPTTGGADTSPGAPGATSRASSGPDTNDPGLTTADGSETTTEMEDGGTTEAGDGETSTGAHSGTTSDGEGGESGTTSSKDPIDTSMIAFHRPAGPWTTFPVLFANGDGTWDSANADAPSWVNQPDVVALPGDYDGDGLRDVAFHRPSGPWTSVPVLFANGDGTWTPTNSDAPSWANQPDVVAIRGDFNGDGLPDVAFHRPGGPWATVPVLFANGDGTWTSANTGVPSWANQPDVIAIPGDYDGNGTSDIAFHRPGSVWATVPVLFSNGDGSWDSTNSGAPGWANQPDVIAIPGDYNGDGLPDVAFHRPGGVWVTVPILFSNGNGTWSTTNSGAPSWANQPDVVAIPGDYTGDGLPDIAFHRPGGTWTSVPILSANGDGTWNSTNSDAPSWANQPGVVAVPGDYDGDDLPDVAFHRPGGPWTSVPVLFANGDSTWTSTNSITPEWSNELNATAVPL